ncbi:hypothetical protein [Clostridium luticellarii]|uniref:Uncharacterized protein n=1 Tax=Clostridium luticellarii TaxID=1691940 RepID=A0A2T0BQ01_9CLOT|nr:hypothetical protein [Clostridium luticellarii]PRR85937.1 hypothetical protein CLLU_09650 [Clostridium luticellarii]
MDELKSILDNLQNLKNKINQSSDKNNNKLVIFIGVLLQVVASKKLFKRNKDVAEFLNINFNLEFAEYCKKSRPIMLGKTAKYFLEKTDDYDLNESLNIIYSFIVESLSNTVDDVNWSNIIKKIKL